MSRPHGSGNDVGRVGAGRIDDRHDFGEGERVAVGVVGGKRVVPRYPRCHDVVAGSGAAAQPHGVGVGDGRTLVQGVRRVEVTFERAL
jgi:hypothetical protein